jgi:Zn-dependent peptidase ImmA (M78 family)/DNA-binding XRE family transcriptional regulator
MRLISLQSWEAVGSKVASARKLLGLSQQDLADQLELDRTAVSRIESGQRGIDSLELSRLSRALQRPIDWFLTASPAAIVSRRSEVIERRDLPVDALLESLARDVELLVELGFLVPVLQRVEGPVGDVQQAEAAAAEARRKLGCDGPAWDLVRLGEKAGLYAFSLGLERQGVEGCYMALDGAGVAAVNGIAESGRRRFTLAHELGHHLLADEYSADWDVGAGASERERLVNAFAVHFLLPRADVSRRWEALAGAADRRNAAIHIGVEFGVSWSATCSQLRNLQLISPAEREQLIGQPPSWVDYVERELAVREELSPPQVPPGYAAAVAKAFRKNQLGASRAMELMRGTLGADDFPSQGKVPLDALRGEVDWS